MEEKKKEEVVSKRMIIIAMTAPFLFSIGFMLITFLATINSSSLVRNISLIVATFVGLGLSIVMIFILQRRINRKLLNREE